ncbi:hypothetical protein IE53DRAFT_385780 [Violaceomyces palustris]|uniref:Uncharacterized protein n=1 Tax=Violaceomyces palustris TaxID=1673888 RepID=A0ACD0P1H8_9BASI|nr:hypothetical protein IE53DRAFT_385780 [Violaceomyces palustris]
MFSRTSATAALVASLALAGVQAQSVPKFNFGTASADYPGVKSTQRNGPTNPSAPMLNTPINQTSVARLATINSIDDWCTFGPPSNDQPLGNVEGETVAYCTKPRNNARVIPDGTVTGAHFVKTPLYIQLMATGDFTKIGMMPGDEGGELDPHGATNMGNPVGGNVTSNISGEDVFYEEWMNYVSATQICFRICIAGSDLAPTPLECQHELDVMGCNFVMPGNYADGVFDTCDGDSAYPPGLYPQADGSTSTFHQFFTGTYVVNGEVMTYTNGAADQITPTAAYSTPSTSNCKTTSTISNGIRSIVPTTTSSSTMSSSTMTMSSSRSSASSSQPTSSGSSSNSNSSSGASNLAVPALAMVAAGLVGAALF